MNLDNLSTEEIAAELKRRSDAKFNQRKAYKELVDETIPEQINSLIRLNNHIAKAKTDVYQSLQGLMELKQELYGAKSNQRSHSFTTQGGKSVEIGYRITDGWDDTVSAGEAKVASFINSLAKDANSKKLVSTVNRLLKRDGNGNLKASRVIELKSLADEFNDELFNDGVAIILEAYRPKSSAFYIKAAYKDTNGVEKSIPLSISAVDFTDEVDLSIFKTQDDSKTENTVNS